MNLYLRMLWVIAQALRAPKLVALESFELQLRVLPNDLDVNGHMNNARYLALVDLALVALFIRSGFSRLYMERKWRPMAAGSIIHYRRALAPLQAFTLRSR